LKLDERRAFSGAMSVEGLGRVETLWEEAS
jgi:hypothetical protein